MLAERSNWADASPDLFSLVRGKLRDTDPFVRRAAADALGRHPTAENVEPLLDLWAASPPDDTHLVHVTRMAYEISSWCRMLTLASQDSWQITPIGPRVADVSLGVRTAESAAYLLAYVESHAVDEGRLAEYLHDAARTPQISNFWM